ncbi:MAG: CBS domain-containing protein [Myxococcales bacterium]|nr:CBS domain-containing protein [Myxococcales bacterium]
MSKAKHHENRAICIAPDASAMDAAEEMDAHNVGCVVVTDAEDRPLGILTDRDLTLRVVAPGRDPEKTRVSEIMTDDPLTGGRRDSTLELLEKLQERGVRRAPLIEDGRVVGLISLDDLIVNLGVQLWNVSEAVREELRESRHTSRQRRRREAREDAFEELRDQFTEAAEQIRERVERDLRSIGERFNRK